MYEYEATPFYMTGVFWFFTVGLNVVLMIVSYKLAQNKGREPIGWVIFTFFCGILPVIILALISDASGRLSSNQLAIRERNRKHRALQTFQTSTGPPESDRMALQRLRESAERRTASQTKQCPFCAESIQAKAIVCRYCKRELRADQYCALTICNNLIDLEANFITSDGKPVCSEQHAEMANQEEAGTSLTCAHAGCGKSLTPEMVVKGNDGRLFCTTYHRRIG